MLIDNAGDMQFCIVGPIGFCCGDQFGRGGGSNDTEDTMYLEAHKNNYFGQIPAAP